MSFLTRLISSWFGTGLAEHRGPQRGTPGLQLVDDARSLTDDQVLQLSTVWACAERRGRIVATLPLFAYQRQTNGDKTLARDSRLYQLLHDSPNSRMTPSEFWMAMMLNHDLRNAAYARIDRDVRTGEAVALWPMPTSQVTPVLLDDGAMVYEYRIGADVAVLAEENVLAIKGLGNGTTPLDKLAFMRATAAESANAMEAASKLFGAAGKPTGVLMVDSVLKADQRAAVKERFGEMATGSTARLYVLEANMKYQQLSLSPEDQQLLETRRFGVEEICRWFDVPPVLVHHANVTSWGSGIEQLTRGFYTFTILPMLVSIEQAVTKRVLTLPSAPACSSSSTPTPCCGATPPRAQPTTPRPCRTAGWIATRFASWRTYRSAAAAAARC
ncbi:phage portal protein [Paucibacter sp. O1-1]|nr:phage portal protein [Paucibacter sp. O1-1]MDA3825225.1 phage portal protein [Paucibacter sp. O1-1]